MAGRDKGSAARGIASLRRAVNKTALALKGGGSREPDMLVLERRLTPSSGHLGGQGWRRGVEPRTAAPR